MPVYAQCQQEADKISQQYGLPKGLLHSLLIAESGCRINPPGAGAGAVGIGQIKPSTFAAFGCTGSPLDPEDGIRCAGKILSAEISKWGTNALGLAAYHAGDKNVSKSAPCVPGTTDGLSTTLNYVKGILSRAGLPFDAPKSCDGSTSTPTPRHNTPNANPNPSNNPTNDAPKILSESINPQVQRYIILGIAFILLLSAVMRYK